MAKKKDVSESVKRPRRKAVKNTVTASVENDVVRGEEGIDVVVPMVFPSGQVWMQSYREACRKAGRDAKIDERVRSWDLERYFFRGIEKNMPFVRKVHLIVSDEGQVPFWLNTKKVHVVLHKDIIPEELLPTFNSSTIEMWLHRIEGLSETFIYANDDMIALSPLTAEDFFVEGKPVMHCEEKQQLAGIFMDMCRKVLELAAGDYGKSFDKGIVMRDGHSYAPFLLSVLNDTVAKHGKEMYDSCTTFREANNMNQYLYTLEQWFGGMCVNGCHAHRYFSISSDYDRMKKILLSGTAGVACFNDGGIGDWGEMRTVLYKVLQQLLGEKCGYEL